MGLCGAVLGPGGGCILRIALSGTVDPMMAFMLVWFVPGILSYIFWHKKMGLEKPKSGVTNYKERDEITLAER